jgi:hypothetical protein
MHDVVALALPAVEAFDLAIPAQVFGDRTQASRYRFTVCSPTPGLVASTTGYAVLAEHGLVALAAADTVVVPGYLPLEDPGEEVGAALRLAAARGARVVSVCTASSPRQGSRHCAGSPLPGCARPGGCWRSATCRSRMSPPARAWVARRTCACTWRATQGPRPPLTEPPTRGAGRMRRCCRARTSRHQNWSPLAES